MVEHFVHIKSIKMSIPLERFCPYLLPYLTLGYFIYDKQKAETSIPAPSGYIHIIAHALFDVQESFNVGACPHFYYTPVHT
jgi:hypothetical protein